MVKKRENVEEKDEEEGALKVFDVLIHVFERLEDQADIGRCAQVCLAWREAADSHHLWRTIILRLSAELGVEVLSRIKEEEEDGADEEGDDAQTKYKQLYKTHVHQLMRNVRGLKEVRSGRDALLERHLLVPGQLYPPTEFTIVGAEQVGKTSLLLRFRSGNYSDACAWTPSFDYQEDQTTVDGAAVILRYWDTPGRSECNRTGVYLQTSCVLACFAVNDRTSMDAVRHQLVPEVRRARPNVTIVVVGTKSDLRTSSSAPPHSCVPVFEGVALAKELGAAMYVECSAKSGEGVPQVFHVAAKLHLLQSPQEPPTANNLPRKLNRTRAHRTHLDTQRTNSALVCSLQ